MAAVSLAMCACVDFMWLRPRYKIRGVDTPENDCENLIRSSTLRLDRGARIETEKATFAFKKVTFAMLVWRRRLERRDRCWDSPYSSR